MIDQEPLFTHQRLCIYNCYFVVEGKSYEIESIKSLKQITENPGRGLAYACMAVGIIMMLCNDFIAGLGYTIMFLGVALWSIAQPKYSVIIETSNQEKLTFSSPYKKEIRLISDALNAAIDIKVKSRH